jgi:nucleoid-associated protein YgaU
MGKVEKVIVLSVLFLIALILVVSLTVDDPLDKSRVVEAGTGKGRPASTDSGTIVPSSSPAVAVLPPVQPSQAGPVPGVLNAPIATAPGAQPALVPSTPPNVSPAPADATPAAPGLPAGALLKTLEGLEDSILTDMKLYTWKPNDTYRGIAHTYYGDWHKFTVLRRSNEGRNDVQPGEKIFLPVFDSDPVAPVAGPAKAANAPAGKKAAAPKSSGKVHVVKEGESLWKIAKIELGNGARWEEIYELNKDVIPASKALHAGQSLRIP